MNTILVCITAIIITCIICYTFRPQQQPIINTIVAEDKHDTESDLTEDEEAENNLITALGEINNLFGGVDDET